MEILSAMSLKETQTENDPNQDLIEKLKNENDELKSKMEILNDQLETIGSYNKPGIPSTKEDITEIVTAYKASEVRLKQKCLELSKIEESNNELKVRLELEHERRLRAQKEIGQIEKEKVILQKELDTRSGSNHSDGPIVEMCEGHEPKSNGSAEKLMVIWRASNQRSRQ